MGNIGRAGVEKEYGPFKEAPVGLGHRKQGWCRWVRTGG